MDAPPKCYTCGTLLLPSMFKTYFDALDRGLNEREALKLVSGLNEDCYGCNRMLLSYVPLVETQFYLGKKIKK